MCEGPDRVTETSEETRVPDPGIRSAGRRAAATSEPTTASAAIADDPADGFDQHPVSESHDPYQPL